MDWLDGMAVKSGGAPGDVCVEDICFLIGGLSQAGGEDTKAFLKAEPARGAPRAVVLRPKELFHFRQSVVENVAAVENFLRQVNRKVVIVV